MSGKLFCLLREEVILWEDVIGVNEAGLKDNREGDAVPSSEDER